MRFQVSAGVVFAAIAVAVGGAGQEPPLTTTTQPESAAVADWQTDPRYLEMMRRQAKAVEDRQKEFSEFAERLKGLDGDAAAQAWLAQSDLRRDPAEGMRTGPGGAMGDSLVSMLPPPSAWKALADVIEARKGKPREAAKGADVAGRRVPGLQIDSVARKHLREPTLRLLAALLLQDEAKEAAAVADIREGAKVLDPQYLRMVNQALAKLDVGGRVDAQSTAAAIEAELAMDYGFATPLQVPDLVTILGKEKAEALLRRLIVSPKILVLEGGVETQAMARRLGVELVDKMKVAQWSLVYAVSDEDVALYEAMDKKFPAKPKRGAIISKPAATSQPSVLGNLFSKLTGLGTVHEDPVAEMEPAEETGGWNRAYAKKAYMFGLMAAGRADDAVKASKEIGKDTYGYMGFYFPQDVAGQLARNGKSAEAVTVIERVLAEDPEIPLWATYADLSVKLNRGPALLAFVQGLSERPGLTVKQRAAVTSQLVPALLAVDRVEEGVAGLRKVLEEAVAGEDWDNVAVFGKQLATIGQLTKTAAWEAEGTNALLGGISKGPKFPQLKAMTMGAVEVLQRAGDDAQAEALLTGLVAKMNGEQMDWMNHEPAKLLAELMAVRVRLKKSAEAGRVLEVPYWGEDDVAGVIEDLWTNQYHDNTFALDVAKVLAEAGDSGASLRALEAGIARSPGDDRLYAAYIERVGNDAAIARLDKWFSGDAFEERPLIWKAEILRRQGKLDEAEKVARQAIAIDPSDGETGKGRRMFAYEVLARILADKGDVKQADKFKGMVAAIRMAEEADALVAAGLLKRGIEMYEKSLTLFADAYCVQSRLAVQLAALGRMEEAEAHYQRAFELMPGSFGRVQNHFFECEGAFKGEMATRIAEKVFTKLLAANPEKPQLQYLMGFLRLTQRRFGDAVGYFRKATELDGDCLNAWIKLEELNGAVTVPKEDLQRAYAAMARLDPLGKHATRGFAGTRNLRGLWDAAAKALEQGNAPVRIRPLRTAALPAGQEYLVALRHERAMMPYGSLPRSPQEVVATTDVLGAVHDLMELTNQ